MTNKTTGQPTLDALYQARKGTVDFVTVPELAFVMVDGVGAPEGSAFADAVEALYSVSYGSHFALKKATGAAPRVMPLEALWWVEGPDAAAVMQRIARGSESDRNEWHWRAMIMQLPPLDGEMIGQAVAAAKAKKDNAALDVVRFESWTEGPAAQTMHIGSYASEAATIASLHKEIVEHGRQMRGRHHEIYLGDPRRSAPEKLRTILRQPIEPA